MLVFYHPRFYHLLILIVIQSYFLYLLTSAIPTIHFENLTINDKVIRVYDESESIKLANRDIPIETPPVFSGKAAFVLGVCAGIGLFVLTVIVSSRTG
jgi:hypothetical protein